MRFLLLLFSPFFFVSFSFSQISTGTIAGPINASGGVSLDKNGNLYVADFGDFLDVGDGRLHNIWKIDQSANVTTYSSGFFGASGNDFDSSGVLYQSDIAASAIYKVINGQRTFVTSTGISNPVGIVFDSQDNFYVCNCGSNTIRKVTPSGVSTVFSSSGLLFCPNGITIDENDNLYVSNFSNGSILKITPSGVTTQLASTPTGVTSGPSNGHLDYFEGNRTLYIASHSTNRIYSLPLDGPMILTPIAGTGQRGNQDNSNALLSTFSRPNGVAVSKTGDTIFINSSVPTTNTPNRPLNPSMIRMITGVQSGVLSVGSLKVKPIISVFPNPSKSTSKLNVSSSIKLPARLRIINSSGKILFEKERIDYFPLDLDLLDLEPGVHQLIIENPYSETINKKLILY